MEIEINHNELRTIKDVVSSIENKNNIEMELAKRLNVIWDKHQGGY